jgi:hypothetical protein
MTFVLDIIAYHEWYNHPKNDPYSGSYKGIFPLFDAVTPTESPATLTNRVATDMDMKLAFVHIDELGEVHVIHRVRRFIPQTGVLDPQDNMNSVRTFPAASTRLRRPRLLCSVCHPR